MNKGGAMMRKMELNRSWIALLCASVFCLGLLASGADAAEKLQRVSFGSGSTAGALYPMFGAIAEQVNSKVRGVKMTVEVTAASVENLRLAQGGRIEFWGAGGDVTQKAVQGAKPFTMKFDKIRSIGWMHGSMTHIVARKGTGIKSIYDLKGKRVGVGPPGSGAEETFRWILEAHDMSLEDFHAFKISYAEEVAAMQDRRIDAAIFQMGVPVSAIVDLQRSIDLELISVGEKEAKRFTEKYPLFAYQKIPKGSYKDQTEDVMGLNPLGAWGSTSDVPEDLVYKVTKVVHDNLKQLSVVQVQFKDWQFDPSVEKAAPLHPGAIKFYKEKGLMK
jgi:hypothetical protein